MAKRRLLITIVTSLSAVALAGAGPGFRHWLPSKSAACRARLSQFFTQWFDTAYPSGGGTNRPAITGPGLAGPGFYDSSCRA